MSRCLQILTLTTWIKSPSAGWLPNHPKIQVRWTTACSHAEKRVKQGNHWANTATLGSKHKYLPKDMHTTSLLVSQFSRWHGCQWATYRHPELYHRRCCFNCGKSILCDSHVTSAPLGSLHLITLVDTCAKTEHLNSWEKEEAEGLYKWVCQTDMLHYSRGSRSLSPWVSQG